MAIITSSEASTSAGPSTVRGNGQQDHQPSQKGHPHLREVAAEEEEEDDEEDELFQEASSQYIAGEGVQGDDDTVDSGDEEGDWHDTLQLADIIETAKGLKAQGNAHFAAERSSAALDCYKEALAHLPPYAPPSPPPVAPSPSKGRQSKGKGRADLEEGTSSGGRQSESDDDDESQDSQDEDGPPYVPPDQAARPPQRTKEKIRELQDEQDERAFVEQGQRSEEEKEVSELRAALWNNVSACHMRMSNYKEAVASATEALKDQPDYFKALQRRAAANEKLQTWTSLSSALEDYNTLATLPTTPPSFQLTVRQAQRKLPSLIELRKQEETKEMLDKLKGLGNKFLGKFGLSTDNFQFVKNEETGGYSMNFTQNGPSKAAGG